MSNQSDRAVHLLSLNHDVLGSIISCLSYRDALSLSYTCKAAHTLCLDPALRAVVIDRSSDQLIMFKNFLLAEASRPLFLRSLTVTKTVTWDLDGCIEEVASAIADILEAATKLEHFSCGAIRDLVKANTRIQSGLVALQHLLDLTLLEGGQETSAIATSLQSPHIKHLTLDMLFNGPAKFQDFYGRIAKYRRVESLSISRMYDRIAFPSEAHKSNISIPSLRTLVLHTTFFPLSLAASTFPNVTKVTFANARHYPNFSHPPVSPVDATSCWPTLLEAHIDARDLAVWPISSRVRWLDLEVLRGGYSSEAIAAVDRMRPRVLSCAYTIDADNLFWVRLPVIASGLRFLDVRLLELSNHPRKYMLMHLSRFPALTALFLCIRAFYQPVDADAEIVSIAHDLASRNSKLQFIGISFTDGRNMKEDYPVWDDERLSSQWFAVRRDGDGSGDLDKIPTETGLSVREYMYQADYDAPEWEARLHAIA
ncbi:hypothetical protein PYCCODRAFT_1429456 [Trametes coccinea BRFM310]|uniref:F-box domain-containing protein n=1 Tax=Trametes coccinea (strain BRFM310) TaxID=1353009 RepID=A0A1Y2J4X6_TRAC3|nr:hypothetical protein PYCCODRAFT_1429456 [Trametes coccinea BRFM310]